MEQFSAENAFEPEAIGLSKRERIEDTVENQAESVGQRAAHVSRNLIYVRLLCIFITDSNNTWPAERECVSKIVKFVFFDNIAPRYTLRGNMRGENGWKANGIKLVKLRIFLFFPNLFFTSSKKFFLEHDLRFQRNV